MSTKSAWSGAIDSTKEQGINTGLKVNKGDKITIIATGLIKYGKEDHYGLTRAAISVKADKKRILPSSRHVLANLAKAMISVPAYINWLHRKAGS